MKAEKKVEPKPVRVSGVWISIILYFYAKKHSTFTDKCNDVFTQT